MRPDLAPLRALPHIACKAGWGAPRASGMN